MSMSRSSTIFTVATVTVLSGLVAYAVYFDYKRRNDTAFRKQLRKEKKRVDKRVAEHVAAHAISQEEIRAALLKVRDEELPPTSEERETYFLDQVAVGEQLCSRGPEFHLPAALTFFRALRVYPSPVELIMIYQKTVPEPVFKLVMELTNLDVKRRIEGYYDSFPPKNMNVSVKPAPGDNRSLKNILVAEKDFEAGDIIYKEHPIVAVLDADLQGKGSHCSHCLRHIQKGMAITPESDRLDSVYCSEDCQVKDKVQSQNLLFGLEPVLPPEMDNGLNELTKRDRNQAQETFTAFLKAQNKPSHLLAARIVARQVTIETAKMSANKGGPVVAELPEGSGVGEQYGLSDHIERLRFINANVSDEEIKKLCEVLASALPGLEKSITDERHAILLGKIAYNAIGICYAGGRDDRPVSDERPEDMERTRTPHGTSRQTGCGLYLVSSYLAHSCAPSARPLFNSGTSELHLVATHPIKKGDELTMAYVDVSQHAEETPEEARRRRRVELARGWKFKCECSRCLSDTPEGAESELGVEKDESKAEEVLRHTLVGEPSGPPTGLE